MKATTRRNKPASPSSGVQHKSSWQSCVVMEKKMRLLIANGFLGVYGFLTFYNLPGFSTQSRGEV